ncbi:MAG: acyl-CoA thioesterase [Ferruginibacter sp.]
MPRIKLEIPAVDPLAEITIPVRIGDINYGNHVGNDAFVAMIHEARVQWLSKKGYSELEISGTALIMSDLAVEFKSEAFYGDNIAIKVYAGELSRVGFELYYQLTTKRANETSIILANAKTGMVCYDYSSKKVTGVNDTIKQLLTSCN